jgi:hypothetical protein
MFIPKNFHELTFWYNGDVSYIPKHYGCYKWCCVKHECPIKLIRQTSKRFGIGNNCIHCGIGKEVKVAYINYYHNNFK